MTARAMTRAFNARLRPLGLQITQYTLLGAIAAEPQRTIAALADALDLEPSAALRNLGLLESRGLIERHGARGRSGQKLQVTPNGSAILEAGVPIWREVQSDLGALLGDRAKAALDSLAALEAAALELEARSR